MSVFLLVLTGCADRMVQSWKSALTGPLKGRGSSSTSNVSRKDVWNESPETEGFLDSSETSQEENGKKSHAAIAFEYIDDTDWVKSEWPDEYAYIKGLDWDKHGDVQSNGNIQKLLDALSVLKEKRPGVSQREIPWESLKENAESYYGDRVWYAGIYLNRIEKIQVDSEEANRINHGNAFAVLHTSLIPEEEENEILMYVMNLDNFDSFYSEDDLGGIINIDGWYIGETDGKTSIVYPVLAGG